MNQVYFLNESVNKDSNSVNPFEKSSFNMGWKISISISLFEKDYKITILAEAYNKSEKTTEAQIKSYNDFIKKQSTILPKVEKLLAYEANSIDNAKKRFSPKMIYINQNGNYAMIFDDKENKEDGIAVTIKPSIKVTTTDQYL